MRPAPRTWLCICVLAFAAPALTGCSPPLSNEGYLRVEVRASSEARAACLRVFVRTPSGTVERSSPIARPSSTTEPFVVAVYQDALGPDVSVEAVGFTDMTGCDTEPSPPEHSETWTGHFTPQVVTTVQLLIAPPRADAGVDAGVGDGGAVDGGSADAGLVDAGDDAGAADSGMADAGPGDGGASDAGAVDAGADAGASDAGTVDAGPADAGLDAGAPDAGSPDAGSTDAGVELCTDGLDNDHDGLIDCQDPDCAGRTCSDFSACTTNDLCVGTSCVGAPLDCAVGLLQCTVNVGCDAGVCLAGPAMVNTGTCNDGLACTVNKSCDGDGGCQGSPKPCPTSTNSCLLPSCSEPSGACGFTVDVGAGCDDSNGCTTGDQCLADGGCGGTVLQCPVQSECQTSGACSGGTCVYVPRSGTCDGGACNGLGQCVPNAATFNYTPSNFTEAQLAGVTSSNVSVNCAVTIDTQAADGGVGVSAVGCQAPVFALRVISQGGGTGAPAAVLVSNDLDLASGGSLTIVGARPAIFVVRGNANLNGPITTSAAVDLNCAFALKDGALGLRGGGGGGGGFGTAGGNGSWAGANFGGFGVGTSGNQTLTPLKGGCSGGLGGGAAAAGRGGGAVQLSAAGEVSVNTTVSANGMGGAGAAVTSRGGGGGGSGGGVLLEGQRVTLNAQAVVVANGGGGGEGSEATSGAPGSPGLSSSMNAPGGANSSSCGGNGGRGGAISTPASGSAPGGMGCGSRGGGGGGGGGSGHVRFNAVNGCTVNPAATVSPGRTGSGSGC